MTQVHKHKTIIKDFFSTYKKINGSDLIASGSICLQTQPAHSAAVRQDTQKYQLQCHQTKGQLLDSDSDKLNLSPGGNLRHM